MIFRHFYPLPDSWFLYKRLKWRGQKLLSFLWQEVARLSQREKKLKSSTSEHNPDNKELLERNLKMLFHGVDIYMFWVWWNLNFLWTNQKTWKIQNINFGCDQFWIFSRNEQHHKISSNNSDHGLLTLEASQQQILIYKLFLPFFVLSLVGEKKLRHGHSNVGQACGIGDQV